MVVLDYLSLFVAACFGDHALPTEEGPLEKTNELLALVRGPHGWLLSHGGSARVSPARISGELNDNSLATKAPRGYQDASALVRPISVEVHGDGSVLYKGEMMFVLITGEHRANVTKQNVQELFAKFREANYFSLKDEYEAQITDNSTTTTAIEFDGHRKQVRDYVGHYAGMPDVVGELEATFDQLAETEKWIRETNGTWSSLLAEH